MYLNGALCNIVKPGDRVEVTGIYKTVPTTTSKFSGVFETVLIAIGIEELKVDVSLKMTPEDIKNIKNLSKEPKAFALLATGIAPNIQGHNLVKQAILLQLLGGKAKELENTTHLRGDINILLVGDPSTAKS